jgi:prepilin-type N-terminal cleavage/methylation domain-containing protein
MRRAFRTKSIRARRGFTLVELMAVVAITGVLAAIGITLASKHLRAAGTVDAVAQLQAIRAAEESFKAENGTYLDCSRTAGPVWYPVNVPDKNARSWVQNDHPDYQWWSQLGGKREMTRFSYLANAGLPGKQFTGSQLTQYTFNSAKVMSEPWYVIQFRGDRDGNGKFAKGLIHSFDSEVYVEDEAE